MKQFQTLMHYSMVDDFANYLQKQGRNILFISYGFYNELDLIVWGW